MVKSAEICAASLREPANGSGFTQINIDLQSASSVSRTTSTRPSEHPSCLTNVHIASHGARLEKVAEFTELPDGYCNSLRRPTKHLVS